ncbi:exopolyphosphatase [Leeia sp. TBRC 13508]|uniref:Exopolyphosphatase n=1 Tax=Leeia speluncae TaxID=2884804 RepID=A0ABS8D763_9NEIS|nr:exopolyphosphatase [Leeia speluncae]MCB6184035.1 exopolyphosphatase [Leeia speluncae]
MSFDTIAAVDLGSNSFRLQVARVVDDQIYPLDSLKETVRLGAGLRADGLLDEDTTERAISCLKRFGERLRDLPPEAIRAVGTNTLRVAKNAADIIPRAEAALGVPIEIIAGREEARLIYLGASHSLPASKERRLVVDIGGGSTEFIIGSQYKALKLESLFMGCVSWTMKYFPEGRITKNNLQLAILAARTELQSIVTEFSPDEWQIAIGTSGTARSLSDIMELNDLSPSGITAEGMEKLKTILLKAGSIDALQLNGLRPDRAPVLPGGFAIMSAIFAELGIRQMQITLGALRDGVMYDLIGRHLHKDMRDSTVTQFKRRYHVDAKQVERVSHLATHFFKQLKTSMSLTDEQAEQTLNWAAKLHEIGLSVSHTGYHKHSAYILEHADMPGFSKPEQLVLSQLALAHRGKLGKLAPILTLPARRAQILALRLGALFNRSRREMDLPETNIEATKTGFKLAINANWLEEHPLTETALQQESAMWSDTGFKLDILRT